MRVEDAEYKELCQGLARINSPLILHILGLDVVVALLASAGVAQAEFTVSAEAQTGVSVDGLPDLWSGWGNKAITLEVNPVLGVINSIGLERWGWFSATDFVGDDQVGSLFAESGYKALQIRKAKVA